MAEARFVVELSDHDYAMVEYEGHGVELSDDLVPVRAFDRALVQQRIDEGKAYLLRVIDPELGGVHKYYDAPTDSWEDRLHTIYTASTIYTLLRIDAHDHDERLREPIERAAGFLLSMQRIAPDQPGHGAFYYSYNKSLEAGLPEREPRFVVGTASKSIFTLIELHAWTGEQVYLDAAERAAEWLMTMQDSDGRVSAELRVGFGRHLERDHARVHAVHRPGALGALAPVRRHGRPTLPRRRLAHSQAPRRQGPQRRLLHRRRLSCAQSNLEFVGDLVVVRL